MHRNIDIQQFSQNSLKIVEKYRILLNHLFKNESLYSKEPIFDPIEINKTFIEVFSNLYANPQKMLDLQGNYVKQSLALIHYGMKKLAGENPKPLYHPVQKDKRFQDESWSDNFFFDLVKQSYLMNTAWLNEMLDEIHVESKTKLRANFFIKQVMNALAPSNFVTTNPTVLKETIATNGENLLHGMNHFIEDLEHSKHIFDIKRIGKHAFEIGQNIACTKGSVVYQNDLMQLIYYTPTAKQVHEVPLLVIPPWINKYYILDLTERDSFVKWILDQGFSVFLVSWVNPGAELAEKSFEGYMLEGPVEAIKFIKKVTKVKEVNLFCYCLGGTLAAVTEAYLHSKGDHSIKSATLLATLLDFKDAGEILVFIDDAKLQKIEEKMAEDGYWDGDYMSSTFSLLRSNDMIWSFFINNYLLGKEPLPFDILYWNADSTRMPAKMHSYYLRNMYMQNNLATPGKLTLGGVPIDLHNVKIPCYFLSAIDDHIAPWEAVYHANRLIDGHIKFVLSGSGHVAGIVNPPDRKKYCYWTNGDTKDVPSHKWLHNAVKHEGSWWPNWLEWVRGHSGKMVKPHGQEMFKRYHIEPAPGRYVLMK